MIFLARWMVVLVFALSSGAMAEEGSFYDVTLLDCHDGDTCRMIIPYLPTPMTIFPVRFLGIDAPDPRIEILL